jgi:hypothetical protein
MAGPIAHGVSNALRKQREAGTGGAPRPPNRWTTWLLVAGIVAGLAILAIAWQSC